MIGFMGGFGGNNLGDELIAYINYSLSEKIGLNKDEIYFFSFNKDTSLKNFPYINWIEYNQINDFFNILKNLKYNNNENLFNNFNKIILGAGGLFYDYNISHLIGWYSRVNYLLRKKIPYSLFGISLQKKYNLFSKILVKEILKNSSYISVRDSLSFRSSKKLIENINQDKIIDPVFYLKNIFKIREFNKTSKILIAPRKWKNFDNIYEGIIRYMLNNKIDFDFWALDLREDIHFCESLKRKFGLNNRTLNFSIKDGIEKIFKTINNYEYVIGVRFHSIVIASILKKKIIAIPYDLKVSGLMKDLSLYEFLYSGNNINKFLDISFNKWDKKGKIFIDRYTSYIDNNIKHIEESFEKAVFY